MIGSASRALFALFLVLVTLPTCAAEETVDCHPAGTYVDFDADLGTATARICFDDRCETLTSKNTPDDLFLAFDSPYWEEGSSFELSIEVFDSNGSLIDSIAEQRTMDSDAEACGVLQYGWPEGRLTRLNERAMTRSALLKASVSHRLGMIVVSVHPVWPGFSVTPVF